MLICSTKVFVKIGPLPRVRCYDNFKIIAAPRLLQEHVCTLHKSAHYFCVFLQNETCYVYDGMSNEKQMTQEVETYLKYDEVASCWNVKVINK